jgi:serine/threonine protein kinase
MYLGAWGFAQSLLGITGDYWGFCLGISFSLPGDSAMPTTNADGQAKTGAKDQVAIRWAAPEAMAKRNYTNKSDVWSFGILLHEVFSYGTKPYEGWSNRRVVDELRAGYCMDKPLCASSEMYEIMMATSHADPNERPEFDELERTLRFIASNTEGRQRASSMSPNKLVERFNAKKQQLQGSADEDATSQRSGRQSAKSHRDDTYRSPSVYRSAAVALKKSTGKSDDSNRSASVHKSDSRSDRSHSPHSSQPSSARTSISPFRKMLLGSAHQSVHPAHRVLEEHRNY